MSNLNLKDWFKWKEVENYKLKKNKTTHNHVKAIYKNHIEKWIKNYNVWWY